KNPLQKLHANCSLSAKMCKEMAAQGRLEYFAGKDPATAGIGLLPLGAKWVKLYQPALADLMKVAQQVNTYEGNQARRAFDRIGNVALERLLLMGSAKEPGLNRDVLQELARYQLDLEPGADFLSAEPPPRALSPIVYDEKTKLYILFGGDHLDYL